MRRAGIAAAILLSPLLIIGLCKTWFAVSTSIGLGVEEAVVFSIFSVGLTVVIAGIYLVETSGGGDS